MKKLFIFGLGYVAKHLVNSLKYKFEITGTSMKNINNFINIKINIIIWDGLNIDNRIIDELKISDAVLISIPPNNKGDLAYTCFNKEIKKNNIKWIGYLSTTGVYGDYQGQIVNENSILRTKNKRSKNRVLAENQWKKCLSNKCNVSIFRLSGIYGIGRSIFDTLITRQIKRIDARINDGRRHFFCRIHVFDIVQVIESAIEKNINGINTYNVADDLPAPYSDIIKYAATIMNIKIPLLLNEKEVILNDFTRSFYTECRYVDNSKIKKILDVNLKYKNYKQGLKSIWKQKHQLI